MGISVSKYGAATPMNYSVQNKSDFSTAYSESVKQVQSVGGFSTVDAASPVGYANAQIQSVDPAKKVEASQQVNAAFNDIAAGYGDTTTGYDSGSTAISYGMVGSNFDAYI